MFMVGFLWLWLLICENPPQNTIIKETVLNYAVLFRKKKVYPNEKVIENGSQGKK